MLTVSPLTNGINARQIEMEAAGFSMEGNEFPNFSTGNLLDTIDFDDLFVGISDGGSLPDLEMDPEILAEFSCVAASIGDEFEMTVASPSGVENSFSRNDEDRTAASVSASDLGSGTSTLIQEDEIASKRAKESSKVKKPSKKLSGKKKTKVDWTPELHRRFVQAVEQLGVDKAVPSRILEIMGIDCLTRHNIASHLQKYRSHRKHLLAREAEAATWSQRRQIYGGVPRKRDVNPWIAPTIGFPPVAPMPHFRPLHVWGHPSAGHSMVHMWPSPPPLHTWPPTQPRPSVDSAFWHSSHQHVPTRGTPCYPPHLPPARFPAPPVPGIPPPAMYKIEPDLGLPTVHHGQTLPRPPCDVHPTKESVDAAIGDVLSKPWLPLPLGLKPPSMDSVMGELQRQGVSKIPPTCT